MKPTAIGYYVCIQPALDGTTDWCVVFFDKRGFYKGYDRFASKDAAIKRRRKLIGLHLRLAKERCNRRLARIGKSFVSGMSKGAKK